MQVRPFILAGWTGIAVVLVSLLLMLILPSRAGRMPQGFVTPILAFEFIETKDEVQALFEVEDQEAVIVAMDLGNKVDFLYMILYSAFLFLFAYRAHRIVPNVIVYGAMILSVVVLIGDFLENLQLLTITQKFLTGNIDDELALLQIFTWQKWGGLAMAFICLIPYWISGRFFAKGMAFFSIVIGGLGMGAFVFRSVLNEIFALAVALMFLLMIVYCFVYREEAERS